MNWEYPVNLFRSADRSVGPNEFGPTSVRKDTDVDAISQGGA
jgi:hypothetical protein